MTRIRILGLDPGLQKSGWGVVDIDRGTLIHAGHGVIETQAQHTLAERLAFLHQCILDLINMYDPDEVAVEQTFVNKNPVSTLKLGMARGVCLLTPAHRGLAVHEYGANQVKKVIVGVGHADKDQVAMMVRRFLPKAGAVTKDAADALAIALCHGHMRETAALYQL